MGRNGWVVHQLQWLEIRQTATVFGQKRLRVSQNRSTCPHIGKKVYTIQNLYLQLH